MNFRTTFILLILLLGVGAYVMFTSSGKSTDTLKKPTDPQRLLDIASNDVNKLVITPSDGKRIVLERNTLSPGASTIGPANSDWKLTEPISVYADAMKVSDLLEAIVSSTSTSQVEIGTSAAEFGLDTPQFTVDVDAGPKSAKLDIGRLVKAGNELYVRVEGKDVAEVVSGDLLDKLDTTAEKLRLSRLVNADATTANWISIQRPQDGLDLEKVAGNWQVSMPATQPTTMQPMTMAQPTTMPAESSVVTDLVSALNNAQAAAFGDGNDNAALLIGQPRATVTISDQKPTTQPSVQTETIEFGSPDSLLGKNVWVRVTPPGLLAKVPKETMDSVLKGSLDLRSRQVVKIEPSTVRQIRIVKNIPATTQPVALPAKLHEVVLVRRPIDKRAQLQGPTLATTHPTSGPTTLAATALAATAPSTQPVAPESVWQVVSTHVPSDADDAKVDAALAVFNPLRADKYVGVNPTTAGRTTYLVTLTTYAGPPVELAFVDPGETATEQPTGRSSDAIFNVPRTVITALDGEFTKNP